MQHDGFKKTTNVDYNGSPLNNYDYGVMAAQRSIDDFKKTMITFDKGGYWTYLTPPTHDSQGKRVLCRDVDCALHLHSISSYRFGPFYTTENSIGIIIGTGNVGDYLSNDPEDINTYMSRDGGLTWYEVSVFRGMLVLLFLDIIFKYYRYKLLLLISYQTPPTFFIDWQRLPHLRNR